MGTTARRRLHAERARLLARLGRREEAALAGRAWPREAGTCAALAWLQVAKHREHISATSRGALDASRNAAAHVARWRRRRPSPRLDGSRPGTPHMAAACARSVETRPMCRCYAAAGPSGRVRRSRTSGPGRAALDVRLLAGAATVQAPGVQPVYGRSSRGTPAIASTTGPRATRPGRCRRRRSCRRSASRGTPSVDAPDPIRPRRHVQGATLGRASRPARWPSAQERRRISTGPPADVLGTDRERSARSMSGVRRNGSSLDCRPCSEPPHQALPGRSDEASSGRAACAHSSAQLRGDGREHDRRRPTRHSAGTRRPATDRSGPSRAGRDPTGLAVLEDRARSRGATVRTSTPAARIASSSRAPARLGVDADQRPSQRPQPRRAPRVGDAAAEAPAARVGGVDVARRGTHDDDVGSRPLRDRRRSPGGAHPLLRTAAYTRPRDHCADGDRLLLRAARGRRRALHDVLLVHDSEYDEHEFLELVLEAREASPRDVRAGLPDRGGRGRAPAAPRLPRRRRRPAACRRQRLGHRGRDPGRAGGGAPAGSRAGRREFRSLLVDVEPEDPLWRDN